MAESQHSTGMNPALTAHQAQVIGSTPSTSSEQQQHNTLETTACQAEAELQNARTQIQQMKADMTLQRAISTEQKQRLSQARDLESQLKEEVHCLTTRASRHRLELQELDTLVHKQQQQIAHHTYLLSQQQQQMLSEQSAAPQKLQQKLEEAQAAAEEQQHAFKLSSEAEHQAQSLGQRQQQQLNQRVEMASQMQHEVLRLQSVVEQQQHQLVEGEEGVQQLQQLLLDKEVLPSEQHGQLLQQDGLLRQQRELLVNQDTALQAYKGSASPRARWGHIHLQLAHRHARAHQRRHLAALFHHWLSTSRRSKTLQRKLRQFGARCTWNCVVQCFSTWASLAQSSRIKAELQCAQEAQSSVLMRAIWYAWRGFSPQAALQRKLVSTFRRQRMLHKHWAVFKHWQTVSSVRVLLQRQGRAVAGSLQALRLRQAWQLWRRNHRQALAAQQRKYIRMVYDLLKGFESNEAALQSKEAACQAAQHEVASTRLQLEACRERLEGVKEEVGLSQEALLQEHEAALQLQLQAREDIENADQAVAAVASMLHQLAPNGDITMATHALQQAQYMSRAVRRLPRSLSQWLPPTGQHPSSIGPLPSSRLTHVLQRHFPPLQSARHTQGDGQLSYRRADSASGGYPEAAPLSDSGLGYTQQQQPLLRQREKHGGRKAARAAGALLKERHERVKPVGRVPTAEGRPQSAGSNADPAAKGRPAVKGKTKPRARSVSPNSQYHFSCNSSVPDHGSSWFGDDASVVSQDLHHGRVSFSEGRACAKWLSQMPLGQVKIVPPFGPGPAHTTFVMTHQHGGVASQHDPDGQEVPYRQRNQGRQQLSTGSCQQREQHAAVDGTHGSGGRQTAAAGLQAHSDQLQQPHSLKSTPGSPGGLSMAPPLEPPSTVKPGPAGARWASDPHGVPEGPGQESLLSPFLQRVAHQTQCDAELLGVRHSQRKLADTTEHRPAYDDQKAAWHQKSPQAYEEAATAADKLAAAVMHSSGSLYQAQSQRDTQEDHAQRQPRLHQPAHAPSKESCQPRCHPGLLVSASQQSQGMLAACLDQHHYQPVHSLDSVSYASQHMASASQPKVQTSAGHTDDRKADRESAGSVQGQQHRQVGQQEHTFDGRQHQSPSSRQSIRQCHQRGAASHSLSSDHNAGITPSSQQASNSLEAHSRRVAHPVRPAASLVTQCAKAGSIISHDARSAADDSPTDQAPALKKLPEWLDMSTSDPVESPAESEACQRKRKKSGWSSPAGSHWSAASGSSSRNSSNSSSLDQRQLRGERSVHQPASESMMVAVQLPSPLPDSSSEDEDGHAPDVFDAATGRPLSLEDLTCIESQLPKTCSTHPNSAGLHKGTTQHLQGQVQRLPDLPAFQQQSSSSADTPQTAMPHQQQCSKAKHLIKPQGLLAMNHAQAALRASENNSHRDRLHSRSPGQSGTVAVITSCRVVAAAGKHSPKTWRLGSSPSVSELSSEKRSPLKGSNAWPPPSPSPKKGKPSRSQNRAPIGGSGPMQPALQQPRADPLALHNSFRSHSSVLRRSRSFQDR